MKRAKATEFSSEARADIHAQAAYYAEVAGEALVARWEESLTSTLRLVAVHSLIGRTCHFRNEQLQGLRQLPVRGFPNHLLFYRVVRGIIVVERVIHGARDLESLFSTE